MAGWKSHMFRAGTTEGSFDEEPSPEEAASHAKTIEPWLTAVAQSEHISLLLGSGFTTGVANADDVKATGMEVEEIKLKYAEKVLSSAAKSAESMGRGKPNLEDQLRAALALAEGLEVIGDDAASAWKTKITEVLERFGRSILETERNIKGALDKTGSNGLPALLSFLMSFASRAASRERLHIFTTNYDRLIEHGCDELGLRIIDRFVGSLQPEYRSSRQLVDLHYNPPGIRGEPRYLEGVVRLTKLHGSIDWIDEGQRIVRRGLAFGADLPKERDQEHVFKGVMIYPIPAKDVETMLYPYADLFRDMSASVCQPNSALITYGYGFGDDHINRVLRDMLTIPSTHLVIMSWNDPGDRIKRFCDRVGRSAQISLLIGSHFGNIETLVRLYLPKPAIDLISFRRNTLVQNRHGADRADGHGRPVSASAADGAGEAAKEAGNE